MTSPVSSHEQDQDSTTPLLPSHHNARRQTDSSSTSQNSSVQASLSQEAQKLFSNMTTNLVAGAAFGAALTASGVYQPSVIIGQLKLENWHMMQAFLTATASSAVFIAGLDKLGYCRKPPRPANTINIFAKHDGNWIGGALLGAGMALAGACPGTVLAQVGVGIKSGYYALDGAILAGVAWTAILRPILRPCAVKPEKGEPTEDMKLTLHEHMNCPRSVMLVGFEALCAAAVAGTVVLAGPSSTAAKISPILGGFLIGLSQLLSLLLRRDLLGASSAYEQIADHAAWLVKGAPSAAKPRRHDYIAFATGVVGGAWALGKLLPGFVEGAAVPVPPVLALSGGFLMVLGARMANGCTSGHGISGMSMFSVSSFITIGTALVVGVLTRSVVMPAFA